MTMPKPNDDLVSHVREIALTLHHHSQLLKEFEAALLRVADSLPPPSPDQPELRWLCHALRERREE